VRSGLGDRLLIDSKRKVRTPAGRVLGNAQAEKSDTGATENKPPMNGVFLMRDLHSGKGETVG